LHAQVMSDAGVSSALAAWRSCMADHGWDSFQHQEDAYSKVFDAYWANKSNAHQLEFSIAPADAQCTVSSKYGSILTSTEKRVAASARQSLNSTIVAFLDVRRKALAVATTVLSTS
jgi:hypothetical protein